MRKILSVIMVLTLAACGGGGGGGSSPSWSGTVNSSGYPDVAGTYAFVFPAGTISCTGGETGPVAASSTNLVVSQTGNVITVTGSSPTPAGYSVVSNTATSGNVEKSGTFIVTSSSVFTSPTYTAGTIAGAYSTTGTFTPTAITGTLNETFTFSTISGSCAASLPFTATKL